jgi:hypothetical protein
VIEPKQQFAAHFFTGRGLTLRQKSGWLGGSHYEFTQTNARRVAD